MGMSLPDLSFLEGAPGQNCTPRLSPHISSALLVLLREGGEGALLALQQNLPEVCFQRGGSVCESPTADSVLEGVHASPCYFTIGTEFSSMPPFQNPMSVGIPGPPGFRVFPLCGTVLCASPFLLSLLVSIASAPLFPLWKPDLPKTDLRVRKPGLK